MHDYLGLLAINKLTNIRQSITEITNTILFVSNLRLLFYFKLFLIKIWGYARNYAMFMFGLNGNAAQTLIDTERCYALNIFVFLFLIRKEKNPGESNNYICMHLLLRLMFAKKQLYIFTSQVSRHKQVLFKSSSAVVFLFWLPIC